MRSKRRVPAPRRSHPAVWTAICGRGARLPLPKTPEPAILRLTIALDFASGAVYGSWFERAFARGNHQIVFEFHQPQEPIS